MPQGPASRVVCFGEALIDLLAEPDRYGRPDGRFIRYAGGAPANVAVAVARLGGAATYVGMLARDPFGDFLLASLAAEGVDVQAVVRTDAAPTGLAFVRLGPDGERRFSFYRPPAADLLFRAADLRPDTFADAAVFHACSNSLTAAGIARATLAGARLARKAGALVSFDLNLRPDLWPPGTDPRPRLWQLLRNAHLVKFSSEELAFLGGRAEVLAGLWKGAARLAIVTDGARPIRVWSRNSRRRVAPFAVQSVDSTAAGDAFVGGFLAWLCTQRLDAEALGADPENLMPGIRLAAACGAIAVGRHGAFAAMPTRKEVDAFLRTHR